jgi:D-serine deaminase-like pyridoxal phosphate-dependent protein
MSRDHIDLCSETLQTPCLVVDRSRISANIERLKQRFAGTDVVFRPHLKTIKSYGAAVLAMESPQGPAAVSTLREAEEFGGKGITELLYAVAIPPQKLKRVSALRCTGVDLQIVVDSVEAACAVAEHAKSTSDRIPVLIEIDVDGHRGGIALDEHAYLIDVGRAIARGTELRGVLTHAGESYRASTAETLVAAAEQERSGALAAAKALRDAGLACPVVSIGSTPTALSAGSLAGVTEIRAGVFMLFDLFQLGVGVCRMEDLALSVVTTVIGNQRRKNWTFTDAGWMALSSDRSTQTQAVDQYFGLVCDIDGCPFEDLVVLMVSQEHGVLAPRPGSSAALPELPIGTRLRILPNHACATAAQHAEYKIVDRGRDVVDVWTRFGGW